VVRPELEDLRADVLFDQRPGRPFGDDQTPFHDDEPVAQPRGLLHVMGGEDEGLALIRELAQPVPDEMAGLRVEPRSRLVEDDDLGIVEQRPGDEQTPLHPARELLDGRFGFLGELHEVEKLLRPPEHQLAGKVVVPAVDEQVLLYLELVVEVVLLGDDPDAAFDLSLVVVDVETGDGELSTRRYYGPVDHLHGRRLPSPVRAQKTETFSTEDFEVDTLDRLEARVALLQTSRLEGRLPSQSPLGSLCLRVQPPTSLCSRKCSPAPTPGTVARRPVFQTTPGSGKISGTAHILPYLGSRTRAMAPASHTLYGPPGSLPSAEKLCQPLRNVH
jgi:hypothetical protein